MGHQLANPPKNFMHFFLEGQQKTQKIQGGPPDPVISRVITLVIHLCSAIYRGFHLFFDWQGPTLCLCKLT